MRKMAKLPAPNIAPKTARGNPMPSGKTASVNAITASAAVKTSGRRNHIKSDPASAIKTHKNIA